MESLNAIPAFWSMKEVAQRLHVSFPTMFKFIQNGSIKSVRIGGRRLIPKQALEDFIKHLSDPNYEYTKGEGWEPKKLPEGHTKRGRKRKVQPVEELVKRSHHKKAEAF